jgi:hypothetical protein
VAGAVDYQFLTGILKQTLLMILAGLALSFFTLVMESLLGKNTEKRRAEYKTGNFETPEPQKEVVEETVPPTAMPETMPAATPEESPLPFAAQTAGLYSPHNIGWEDYTGERLESELRRCASTGQDLTFIAMEFKRQHFQGEIFYKQFAEDAVHFFFQKDLIFEKGERGVTVICPGAGLEAAFEKCGEFHNRIMDKYPETLKSKTDLCIGLSACAGRPINAERLMFEANEALGRALEDPVSHIVAFKSDPDKYQAFIRSQGLSPA